MDKVCRIWIILGIQFDRSEFSFHLDRSKYICLSIYRGEEWKKAEASSQGKLIVITKGIHGAAVKKINDKYPLPYPGRCYSLPLHKDGISCRMQDAGSFKCIA